MQAEEVKEGGKVCIYCEGRPHINSIVLEFPIRTGNFRGSKTYALINGLEFPFPIKDLHPFNKGYRTLDDLQTSEEWFKELKQKERKLKIIDPDGWDRSNFHYSWSIERISRQEFNHRLMESTVSPLPLIVED
jgi:hypothetical protein